MFISNSNHLELRRHIPSWRVIFEIFALSFQHSALDLNCRGMVFARICDMGYLSNRISGVHHLIVAGDKAVPFKVFEHGNGAFLELFRRIVRIVCITTKNAGEDVVCLLNLSNDD